MTKSGWFFPNVSMPKFLILCNFLVWSEVHLVNKGLLRACEECDANLTMLTDNVWPVPLPIADLIRKILETFLKWNHWGFRFLIFFIRNMNSLWFNRKQKQSLPIHRIFVTTSILNWGWWIMSTSSSSKCKKLNNV